MYGVNAAPIVICPTVGLVVLRTDPPNNGHLYLNESIAFDMSHRIDESSADANEAGIAPTLTAR